MTNSSVIDMASDYSLRVRRRIKRLQSAFDDHCEIRTQEQRTLAKALLELIGTDDWHGEGYTSPDLQRDLSIRFHWGHNHRFAENFHIDGRMGDRHVNLVAQFIEGFDLPDSYFEGHSVLDIGCWTGGTTMMLKTLGAGPVLAIEEVRKYAAATHRLVRELYGHNDTRVEARSLFALDKTAGKFDLVYVPGVIYHLSDPVLGLRRLFNRLHDGGEILVESAGIKDERSVCRFKGNREHHGGSRNDRSRSGWAWFWPSAACLGDWLDEAGFEDIRVFRSPIDKRIYGFGRRRAFREITRAGLSVPDVE